MASRRVSLKDNPQEVKSPKKPLENLNSFLYKLWSLVNDETLSAIRWSHDGEKIVIDNPAKFTSKVLINCDKKIFKTKNISSFIRQLNLYGFRRVKENSGKTPIIFKHDSFKRGRVDLLAEIKRKKPVSTKILHPSLASPPQRSHELTTRIHSSSRYKCLPTAHNHPYFNPSSLTRKNVHMPFVTPFAVNHGPTFINLGPNATIFGKSKVHDQAKVVQDEESRAIEMQEVQDKEHYNITGAAEASYYPWHHRGYQATQEPGPSAINPLYSNDVAFQVMMNNQSNYGNYTSSFVNNNMFSAVPRTTSYRNYGDVSESISYPGLTSYTEAGNTMTSFTYYPAQAQGSYSHLASTKALGKLPKVKNEGVQSCCSSDSGKYPLQVSGNRFTDGHASDKRCELHGFSSDEEKECADERKSS